MALAQAPLDAEEYDKCAIEIRVKFRENEDMQVGRMEIIPCAPPHLMELATRQQTVLTDKQSLIALPIVSVLGCVYYVEAELPPLH